MPDRAADDDARTPISTRSWTTWKETIRIGSRSAGTSGRAVRRDGGRRRGRWWRCRSRVSCRARCMGLPSSCLQSCDSLEEPVLWRHRRAGRRGGDRQHYADPQRLGQCADQCGGRRGAVSRGHAGRGAPRRPELHVLPGRPQGPPRPQGAGQGPARGLELPLVGRSRVAVAARARSARRGSPPVAIDWSDPGSVTIHVPAARLPEARSDQVLRARCFPGSQAAGMVKQREGDAARRLTPIYYFRAAAAGRRSSRAKSRRAASLRRRSEPGQLPDRSATGRSRSTWSTMPEQEKRRRESIVLRSGCGDRRSRPDRRGRTPSDGQTQEPRPQVVLLLLVIGTACVGVRTSFRPRPTITPGDSAWRLTYSVELPRPEGARARAGRRFRRTPGTAACSRAQDPGLGADGRCGSAHAGRRHATKSGRAAEDRPVRVPTPSSTST